MQKTILFCLLILGLVSCEKNNTPTCNAPGALTVDIGGGTFSADSYQNTLIRYNDFITSNFPHSRIDIRATKNDTTLMISFIDPTTPGTGTGIATGSYIALDDLQTGSEKNAFVSQYVGSPFNLNGYQSSTDGTYTITDCDPNTQTISGTFSFTFNNTNQKGINGVFTNLCYDVTQ
ncbi:MAG: hypothetical protein MK212_05890 [Saprospiraceae bacterium]|nr:hypothetical protein [Saprospiraceae bacterium]